MSQEKYLVPDIECSEFFTYIKNFKELYEFYVCDDYKMYKYAVDDDTFYVYDHPITKIVSNCKDYNYAFNKVTGSTIRFGATLEDDPSMCKLGPEILDLEISVNGCPKVGGHNCKFCYKNNSDAPATNMKFETFQKILDSFPKNLSQIAFGITGVQTNPDFPKMLKYCRECGVIPNYTLSGADLNDEIIEATKNSCGAVAVSCYEGNKDLCYDTIAKLHEKAPDIHVNMHIVLSEGTLNHVMDVLNDIKREIKQVKVISKGGDKSIVFSVPKGKPKDPRLEFLRHIVFLRIKPVGRASKMNTKVPLSVFEKVIDFCTANHIGYGFDSCSALDVETVLAKKGHPELAKYCESCESSRFSSYISCAGIYWHCSFAEKDSRIKPINVLDYDNANTWWNSKEMNEFRTNMNLKNEMQCPLFNLTAEN